MRIHMPALEMLLCALPNAVRKETWNLDLRKVLAG